MSVIVPVFNGERFMKECLQSIFSQSYQNIEVIVVDDGSTDGSLKIVKEYGKDIRHFSQSNSGTAAARNCGVRAATGTFVALIDQDDMWLPRRLESQVALLKQSSEGSIAFGAIEFFDTLTGTTTSSYSPGRRIDYHAILAHAVLPTQTLLMPVERMKHVGLFDESLRGTDDWDMCLKLTRDRPAIGTEEVVARVRLHGDQQSLQEHQMYHEAIKVIKINARYHTRCLQCKQSIRKAQGELDEHYYGVLRDRAVQAFHSRHLADAVGLLTRAACVNPRAMGRIARRGAGRIIRPPQ